MVRGWTAEGLLFAGALFGAWVLSGWHWLSTWLVGAAYLSWHVLNLVRLLRVIGEPTASIPESFGVWQEVFDGLYRARSRLDRGLQQMERRLRRFEESSAALPDAAVALDALGAVEWLNDAAVSLLGLDREGDVGIRVTSLVRHPDFTDYFNQGEFDGGVEFASPLDARKTLIAAVVPYGRKRHLLVVRDVSLAYHLAQVRRDFFANASHELRTPLTVITGYLEAMGGDEQSLPQPWRRPLEQMRQQADRMSLIIQDMLSLARLESRFKAPETTFVDVPAMLREVCESARNLSADRGHLIELHVDQELGLFGAENELRSAFSNLVDNAVLYTPNGGHIAIAWKALGEGACLEVSDDGEGIPAEHVDRLTERFYRVDVGRSRDSGGTGLGLAIVKHALSQHGAELSVESSVGRGSRFSCHFPATRIATAARRTA